MFGGLRKLWFCFTLVLALCGAANAQQIFGSIFGTVTDPSGSAVTGAKVIVTDVTPGHDFGDQIEIVVGLKADDHVVLNPPDSQAT